MIIDTHVHLAGTGSSSGCRLSSRLRRGPAFWYIRFLSRQMLVPVTDESIREHLLAVLSASKLVDRAVFLALDMPHDAGGQARPEWSHLFVPNDYCAAIAERETKVLFGASVHPARPDALDELDRVAEMGAVLVKWLPSSQAIDPADPAHKPFYAKLAELKLPLLCHVGPEHAIPPAGVTRAQRRTVLAWNDPAVLHQPLEAGVTVIAAHCALPIYPWEPSRYEVLRDLMERFPNCRADISALFLPMQRRLKLVKRVLDELDQERLLLGSDYPLPVSCRMPRGLKPADPAERRAARAEKNTLDRNVRMARAMGFKECVLHNASRVLRLSWPA